MSTNYYNVRKGFVRADSIDNTPFNQSLDEPTYLTFKIEFDFDDVYNQLTNETTYDELPQSLLQMPASSEGSYPDELKPSQFSRLVNDLSKTTDTSTHNFTSVRNYTKNNFSTDRKYSAIDYLLARNEDYRAYLLALFMQGLYALQTRYQFYFQEISGLDTLKGNTPDKGWKIGKDGKIKVKCLEGIDQKIAYLKSLYKAIAWDDQYQRWILPDIYRYFKVNIYVSEIRTFHVSSLRDTDVSYYYGMNDYRLEGINKIADTVLSKIAKATKGANVDSEVLELLSTAIPISCYRCSMCDFDITDHLYQDTYSINNDNMEADSFTIRIKHCEVFNHWDVVKNLFIKNFYSARERKYGAGKSDYNFIGQGFKDTSWFNNTMFMCDSDKYHFYSQSISMGALTEAYEDSIKAAMNTDNVIDLASALYDIIKSSVSEYEAEKASYSTLSTAANPSRNKLKEMRIMTDTLAEVVANAAVAKNDTEKAALELLRNSGNDIAGLTGVDSSVRKRLSSIVASDAGQTFGINGITSYGYTDEAMAIKDISVLDTSISKIITDTSDYYVHLNSAITAISEASTNTFRGNLTDISSFITGNNLKIIDISSSGSENKSNIISVSKKSTDVSSVISDVSGVG